MGQATNEYEKRLAKTRAGYFRDAAQKARDCDEALDLMNKERPLEDMRIGFDLSYLSELFDNYADDLEGKPRD